MHPCKDDERVARIDADDERPGEACGNVDLAGGQRLLHREASRDLDVLHIGESLAMQELFGDVLRGNTDVGVVEHPERRGLGRRLRSG